MQIENLSRVQTIIQGVHVEAILDKDQKIISKVAFSPIIGKDVIIKDFDFFMDTLMIFYQDLNKELDKVKVRLK